MKNKACFLDRDGVLNVELNYLCDPEKIVLEKKQEEPKPEEKPKENNPVYL